MSETAGKATKKPKPRAKKIPKAPPKGTPLSVHVTTPFGISPVGVTVEAISIFKENVAPKSGARIDKTVLDVTADGIHGYEVDPSHQEQMDPLLKIAIPVSSPPAPLDANECIINIVGSRADLGPVPAAGAAFAIGPVSKSIRFKKGQPTWGPKSPVELAFADNYQRIEGMDVSIYQGTIDWAAVNRQGLIKFAYIKCTQGRSITDSNFATNWRGASANSIARGAYHYFIPTVNPADGGPQADWFVDQLNAQGTADTDLPPMIDIEHVITMQTPKIDPKTGQPEINPRTGQPVMITVARNPQPTTPQQNVASLKTFLARVQNRLNRRPLLYTYKPYWVGYMMDSTDFYSSYHLWMAYYPGSAIKDANGKVIGNNMPPPGSAPPKCGGWPNWSIWQYAVLGGITGITTMVDHDVAKVPRGQTLLNFLNAAPP